MKYYSASAMDRRRAVRWGTTWAVGVATVEYLAIVRIDDWGSGQQLLFWLFNWVVPFWCLFGFLLIRLVQVRHLRGRVVLVGCFAALSLASSAVLPPITTALRYATVNFVPGLDRATLATGGFLPVRSNWSTLGLYYIWVTLFYGGLLMTAYILIIRSERTRHLLHQNAMAHSRTEALLDAEKLRTLQSQIEPDLLLESMQELEKRYRSDPERAERLLESLVEFLRFAMHSLEATASTLEVEMKLARAFAQLQRERGVKSAWRIVEDPAAGQSMCKFPSLLMLPLLLLGGEDDQPLLETRCDGARIVVSLFGLRDNVSSELRQQIASRLRALYGDNFRLDSPAHHQFSIILQSKTVSAGDTHGWTTP